MASNLVTENENNNNNKGKKYDSKSKNGCAGGATNHTAQDGDDADQEPKYLDEQHQIMETGLKDQYDEDVKAALAKEEEEGTKLKKKNRPRGFQRADRQK